MVILVSAMFALTILLAGCNQSVDEILGVAQDVIDELFGENNNNITDDVNSENEQSVATDETEENEDLVEQATHETGSSYDDYIASFLERLTKQDYRFYGVSNGFPVDTPYHWVLVDVLQDDPNNDFFEGIFCFDLPYDKEDIKDIFVDLNQLDFEHLGSGEGYFERTHFTISQDFGGVTGSVNYFEDTFHNTCTLMYLDFSGEGTFHRPYGEDSTTMVGDQDVDYQGENGANHHDSVLTSNFLPLEQPGRMLPNNYDELVSQIDSKGYSQGDNTESIQGHIVNGAISMAHFSSGYPKIFPYEWYAVSLNDNPINSEWEAKFCTDLISEQSINLHLTMLANYSANINSLELHDANNKDNLATVNFAFNDEYGTGSWSGISKFYVDESGAHGVHRCIDVSMEFSSEIIH